MKIIFKHAFFFFYYIPVFKYLADKYLQRLKQQTAEDTELVHTSSNKIGMYIVIKHQKHYFVPSQLMVSPVSLWS